MPLWIWFTHCGYDVNPDGTRRRKPFSLMNLTSSTTRPPTNINLWIDPSERSFCGSRGGGMNLTMSYSIYVDELHLKDKLLAIYNPFTGVSVQLPSEMLDDEGNSEPSMGFDQTQISSELPNCMVAALQLGDLCICRPGDEYWMVERKEDISFIFDIIFYKGEVYSIEEEHIFAYDIDRIYDNKSFSCPPRRVVLSYDESKLYEEIKWPSQKDYYLVESNGELLLVTQYVHKYISHNKLEFTVHRVDEEGGRLVRVTDLGDERMLLVGRGCSQSWSMLNKDVVYEQSDFFTKNCIYFFTKTDNINVIRLLKYELNREEAVNRILSYEVHPEYGFEARNMNDPVIWFAPTLPN